MTAEELYELFGRFGSIRQIRLGNIKETRGNAFVVYENDQEARTARDKLSGYNFQGHFLVVLLHSVEKMKQAAQDLEARRAKLEELKRQHNID